MGKKNKSKKSREQQGSAQGSQQRTTQSSGAAQQPPQQRAAQSNEARQSAPVQQSPQAQSAWTTVAGRNASVQQPPQQRAAQPYEARQSAPIQQSPQAQSAWTTVAGRNTSAQQATPPQRSAWGSGSPQQAPQQSTGWSNVARRNSPAQQPRAQQATPPQRSAWGNVAAQNVAPAQQAPQQRPSGPNVAVQNSPSQQPPQQRSAWSKTAAQVAPVEQALSQLAIAEQAPVQQPAAEQAAARQPRGGEQAAGGEASTQKETRNRKKLENQILTRPMTCKTKHGRAGREVLLQCNYFEVLNRVDWCLYQYRVDIAPEEERTFVKKRLLREHAADLGSYLFDGTMLFCSNRLRSDHMELQSMSEDKTPILITIRLTGALAREDHHYIQLFNILMRKCMEQLNLQLVGRNYFDMAARSEIREYDIELWPGYVTSIRQHDKGVLMCAEVSHKVMRIDTVYNILLKIINENRRYGRDYQSEFENAILGTIVLTTYNNRTYRVDDVDWNVNPRTTFQRNEEEISYADYYSTKYQINIKDLQQPLLMSRMSQRQRRAGQNEMAYLIPELCRSTGLTDKMRSNFRLMRALADHTKLSPQTRISKLMHFNNRLLSQPNVVTELNLWNFQLNNQLVQLKGRVLPGPFIITADNNVMRNTFDWNFMMQEKRFFKVRPLTDWAVIIPDKRNVEDTRTFIKIMKESARKMSLEMREPQEIVLNADRADNYVDAIEKLTRKSSLQMIMCILSNNNSTKYSAIKKKVCVDRPIPNQVMLSKNLNQRNQNMLATVSSKIAMQMGCKIGCVPWTVNIADTSNLNIMSVGFDVCHDTTNPGSDFGAMVASIDPSHGIYYSSVSAHPSGAELSDDLALQLKCACLVYRTRNQRLPDAIIIYRDGVGEGQIPFVYNYEVETIVKTLSKLYQDLKMNLKLACVIVTKRINTRLFKDKKNPDPGTVVDDVVTDPFKYDFFLVSQSVREGTVSPTSYNVIYDSTGLTPDQMQQLSHKLCYMYYNFTGPVRVPAPCQFAHKLAFFVSQAVRQRPNNALNQLLYFI